VKGISEMEHAQVSLAEQGEGRDAAIVQNNLAIARYPFEGPARSLATFEDGIAFCEKRGLSEAAVHLRASCPGLLAELGRIEEALDQIRAQIMEHEATSLIHTLIELRSVELLTHLARGDRPEDSRVEWIITAARESGAIDITGLALAAAAAALVGKTPERACSLLAEAESLRGARGSPYFVRQLAAMVRTALAGGNANLAAQLATGGEVRSPLDEHARIAAQAQIAETGGDLAEASWLYADAADRWQQFGNIPERAYALLGQSRCLIALADLTVEQTLRQAAELFSSIGYRPALNETNALLEQTTAAAS
jgi:hypothetical protein